MADEEFQVWRNDIVTGSVTVRVVNEAEDLDAMLTVSRDRFGLAKRIEWSQRIEGLRTMPTGTLAYLTELQTVTGALIGLADRSWTPEMVGKLWEGFCLQVVNFISPPTPSVSSATPESSSDTRTTSPGEPVRQASAPSKRGRRS